MGTENNYRARLDAFPRFPLTFLPTPLVRARNFEQALGPDAPQIWIKRDDMTGLAYGGNKARKLEFLVGDALAKNATVLITQGAAQSNHARQTAAAAALARLRCLLVLDTRKGAELTGNLLLDRVMGADVRLVGAAEERGPGVRQAYADLVARGERPYVIPTGGSVAIGALGYVAFTLELLEQLDSIALTPRRLYFPTSSLGTQAGLVAGALLFGAPYQVQGIAVESTSEALELEALAIVNETLRLLASTVDWNREMLSIDDRHTGDGYAIPSKSGMEAIALLARTEAIVLDPVYTGKALAGLIADVRAGEFAPGDSIVFLHTGGGPSVFANANAYAATLDSKEHLF